jgi:hypothetical protein
MKLGKTQNACTVTYFLTFGAQYLFLINLMMLSVTYYIVLNDWIVINNELERIWKEAVII